MRTVKRQVRSPTHVFKRWHKPRAPQGENLSDTGTEKTGHQSSVTVNGTVFGAHSRVSWLHYILFVGDFVLFSFLKISMYFPVLVGGVDRID